MEYQCYGAVFDPKIDSADYKNEFVLAFH